jgi:hypothetical protein
MWWWTERNLEKPVNGNYLVDVVSILKAVNQGHLLPPPLRSCYGERCEVIATKRKPGKPGYGKLLCWRGGNA